MGASPALPPSPSCCSLLFADAPTHLMPTLHSEGLPLNETTVADQLKKAGYATAIMGKWHLGQRPMFLPGARGFDTYMGIPYSDDMGEARRTPCPGELECASTAEVTTIPTKGYTYTVEDNVHGTLSNLADLNGKAPGNVGMPVQGSPLSPLVFQSGGVSSTPGAQTSIDAYPKNTTVLEQPVDFSTLAPKYREFVVDFIDRSAAGPFFLYMPFSHVHTTAGNQPQKQYASCQFVNKTDRGAFGDALAEVDWLIGEVVAKVTSANILENTLMLFTGDNGNPLSLPPSPLSHPPSHEDGILASRSLLVLLVLGCSVHLSRGWPWHNLHHPHYVLYLATSQN